MTEKTLNEASVEADPFTELKAGRIGLQAFTQALWLCARDSQDEAELALVRLEGLAQDGILDANKYQELTSMTRSLIDNAGTRGATSAPEADQPQVAQTAIERQKAKFLADLSQHTPTVAPPSLSESSRIEAVNSSEAPSNAGESSLVNEVDIKADKSAADAAVVAAVTSTSADPSLAALKVSTEADVDELAASVPTEWWDLSEFERSQRSEDDTKANEKAIDVHAENESDTPVLNLKPAADAEARPGEALSDRRVQPIAATAVQAQRTAVAGDSVHKAATVDPTVTTVQLNTAEHLTFQSDDTGDLEPLHADRSMQYASSVSTDYKRSGRNVFIGALLIAGLVSTWYAQERGWIDVKATAGNLYDALANLELFSEEPMAPDFHAAKDESVLELDQSSDDSLGGRTAVRSSDTQSPQATAPRTLSPESPKTSVSLETLSVENSNVGDSSVALRATEPTSDLKAAPNLPSLGDSASEALYNELVAATRDGKLEPVSEPGTALNLLKALELRGASDLRIQRAKTRVAQAYLSEARRARQANDWAKAELLVSKAVRLRDSVEQ